MHTTIAQLVMNRLGFAEWSLVVAGGASLVSVRETRRTIVVSPLLSARDAGEVATLVGAALLARAPHPGWEATCPKCSHLYTRTKPAQATHVCAKCNEPLEWS